LPNEEQGWWVGVATHVGTYKILTKNDRVIFRLAIRSAMDPAKHNLRLSPIGGETASNFRGDKIFIRSKHEDLNPSLLDDDPNVKRRHITTIEAKDLIGRSFLKESEVDGQ
jgi:hypothetical protein